MKQQAVSSNRESHDVYTEITDKKLNDLEAAVATLLTTQRHDRNLLHRKILDIQESVDLYNSFWKSLVHKVSFKDPASSNNFNSKHTLQYA